MCTYTIPQSLICIYIVLPLAARTHAHVHTHTCMDSHAHTCTHMHIYIQYYDITCVSGYEEDGEMWSCLDGMGTTW